MAARLREAALDELDSGKHASHFLAVALGAAAVFLWILMKDIEFYADEWLIVYSRLDVGAETIFAPFQGSLNAFPIVLYQAVIESFGLETYAPFRVLVIGFNLLCSVLMYVWLRRRLGAWLAAIPAVLLAFFGGAWQDLATSVGILWLMSIAAGLGALIALDRVDRRGDALACALLIGAIGSHTPGIAFAAGAAVAVSLRPAPQRWTRAWVWIVPLALYGLWAIWSQIEYSQNPATSSNLYLFPSTIVLALSAVLAAWAGLYWPSEIGLYELRAELAVPAALALVGLLAVLALRNRLRATVLVGVAMALVFWLGLALVNSEARQPDDSRYLYPGAVIMLIAAAEAARGFRPSPRAWLAIGAVSLLGFVPNLFAMNNGAVLIENNSRTARAVLAAIEISRDTVDPAFFADDEESGRLVGYLYLTFMQAGPYLAVADLEGSPAYSQEELRAAEAEPRRAADITMARAQRLGLERLRRVPPRAGLDCGAIEPGAALEVMPGDQLVLGPAPNEPAEIFLHRFGDTPAYPLGSIPAEESARVAFPRDRASLPWLVTAAAAAPIRACVGPAQTPV